MRDAAAALDGSGQLPELGSVALCLCENECGAVFCLTRNGERETADLMDELHGLALCRDGAPDLRFAAVCGHLHGRAAAGSENLTASMVCDNVFLFCLFCHE